MKPPRHTVLPVAGLIGMVLAGLLLGLGISALSAGGKAPPAPPRLADVVVTPAGVPVVAPEVTVEVAAPAPAPAHAAPVAVRARPRVDKRAEKTFLRNGGVEVSGGWVAGYYKIYEIASETFGVNWLLIASVHRQESAFSTSPGIYKGLNFANCCAGPMQFNVTNSGSGGQSTWARYKRSYRAAARPAAYNHRTATHPSVYDDFDAIMAAAALLRDNGAGPRLDARAWGAAYSYYGHDLTGVNYADEVLARAIGWGMDRFCANCEATPGLLARVEAAWGATVRAGYQRAPQALTASVKRRSRR